MQLILNKTIISEDEACINVKDRGFLLGDGLFETCKIQNYHIEFFDKHYERLATSANALMISFEYDCQDLKNNCMELIKKNKLETGNAVMRISLTRGIGLRGINLPEKSKPTLLITVVPYQPPSQEHTIRAMITGITRNPASAITKFKTLNCLEPVLARQEAQANGFDEGIMLNTNGYIAECSVANIFMIKNNKIITPSIESGILPGIVRNHIISMCLENNFSISEKLVSIDEILSAEEVFQTNSLIGIQSISQINKTNYKTHAVKKLIELYKKG